MEQKIMKWKDNNVMSDVIGAWGYKTMEGTEKGLGVCVYLRWF
jgi:hypothetical protein